MDDDLELDQNTGIWRPRRRTFLIMTGLALAGTILGPTGAPADTRLIIDGFEVEDYWALAGNVGLGTLTLGTQPERGPKGPREYVVVDGRARRNPLYRH